MSFGFNASGTLCRALWFSWESVIPFLYDIVILRRSFEDYMKNMDQQLIRFQDFRLKLKPSKCELIENIYFVTR